MFRICTVIEPGGYSPPSLLALKFRACELGQSPNRNNKVRDQPRYVHELGYPSNQGTINTSVTSPEEKTTWPYCKSALEILRETSEETFQRHDVQYVRSGEVVTAHKFHVLVRRVGFHAHDKRFDERTAFSTNDGHKALFEPVDIHIRVPSG